MLQRHLRPMLLSGCLLVNVAACAADGPQDPLAEGEPVDRAEEALTIQTYGCPDVAPNASSTLEANDPVDYHSSGPTYGGFVCKSFVADVTTTATPVPAGYDDDIVIDGYGTARPTAPAACTDYREDVTVYRRYVPGHPYERVGGGRRFARLTPIVVGPTGQISGGDCVVAEDDNFDPIPTTKRCSPNTFCPTYRVVVRATKPSTGEKLPVRVRVGHMPL